MLSPHPTLRFRDVFPASRHSLKERHAPHRLHLTYNARGAFYQLLRSIPAQKGRTVLLPAFHCTALVEPAARAGFEVRFYRVRPDFSVDMQDVNAKMSRDVAILLAIHYFGFPVEMGAFLELGRRHDSYVIEDCAHSFLSRSGEDYVGCKGDFALFSYYKFAPSLAGGGLEINNRGAAESFSSSVLPLRERAILSKRLLEWMLENSPRNPLSRVLLALERRRVASKKSAPASGAAPSQFVDDPYLFREDLALTGMPKACQHVLESCDWEEMQAARQRNYRLIGKLLRDSKLLRAAFPILPDGVCPWAFPVLLEDRATHEQKLRSLGVPLYTFGEILHPLLSGSRDAARDDAEYLSRRLLLLPVHPQLSEYDVQTFTETLNRFVSELEQTKVAVPTVEQSGPHAAQRIYKGNPV